MSESATTLRGRQVDGHRLAEFVYGTVTGLVAVTGLGAHPEGGWASAAGIVVAGAIAIWLAHGYSIMLSKRLTRGRRLSSQEIGHVFGGSWPIVIAGIVLAVPMLLSGLGLWALDTAVSVSGWLAVAILALVGLLAGAIAHETWPRRLLIAGTYAGLGLLVVAVEFVVHH